MSQQAKHPIKIYNQYLPEIRRDTLSKDQSIDKISLILEELYRKEEDLTGFKDDDDDNMSSELMNRSHTESRQNLNFEPKYASNQKKHVVAHILSPNYKMSKSPNFEYRDRLKMTNNSTLSFIGSNSRDHSTLSKILEEHSIISKKRQLMQRSR